MIYSSGSKIKIFACNSNRSLAEAIAKKVGLELGDAVVQKFSDGEISVQINETIRGADVYIIQSTSYPVNDNLMELLIMIDAMKRASAARITAVMPYYGYARQDRKARARDPISAKLVANLLTSAGANRVLTMDLGSVGRTRQFAEKLNIPLAIIDKRRPRPNVSEITNIIGDVAGKKVVLVDDMIDTAGTITNAANALKERGAVEVDACCTHAVLSGPAIKRIEDSAITELLVLDTIELPEEKKIAKITSVSVEEIFANAIKCIHDGTSISQLFD